jgi:hypothetical protein
MSDPAEHNLALFVEALGLSELEAEIIRVLMFKSCDPEFLDAFTLTAAAKRHGLAAVVACALEREETQVRRCLSLGGSLYRAGALHPSGSFHGPGEAYVSALPFGEILDTPAASVEELVKRQVHPARTVRCDFPARVRRAAEQLEPRFSRGEPGTHALLVGSRLHTFHVGYALAARLEAELLECDYFGQAGWFSTWHTTRYRQAQRIFGGRGRYLVHMHSAPCLLHPHSQRGVPGLTDPPWEHLRLSRARIPTLWLVPRLDVVDPRVLPLMSEIVEV